MLAVSVILGIGLNFTSLDPIKALYWSAVINGVLARPVMVLLMLLVRKERVMGKLIVKGCCTGLVGSQPPPWLFQSLEWGSASRLVSDGGSGPADGL